MEKGRIKVMGQTVKIRNMVLGEGIPKICVPIVGRTEQEVLSSAKQVFEAKPDIVEWRMDFWQGIVEENKLQELLPGLRECLGDLPLLCTFRTKGEGGEQEISREKYVELNQMVIYSKMADAIDVEFFLGEETVKPLLAAAHKAGMTVIGSNHDFSKTPAKEEIIRRLCKMQEMGMDVAKIAVMPQSEADVLTLLDATREMKEKHTDSPVITMSMGAKGVISRMTGEIFGSSLTFAMLGKASAPGQVPLEELKDILQKIHVYGG